MSIQFLTDKEYETVRQDVRVMIENTRHSAEEELIAVVTAYIDQKIKQYY